MLDVLTKQEKIDKLNAMAPNQDYVWAAIEVNLFKTYGGYFGKYEKPFRDTSYSINCIEGKSPKIYKLKKLMYLGYFEAKNTRDKVYVFSDKFEDNDLSFSGYILPYEHGYRGAYDFRKPPKISSEIFTRNFKYDRVLDLDLIAFTENEGLKICREYNRHWRNDMRYKDFLEEGKYIKKTLNSMLKQLNEFMTSEYFVDHEKEIEKDLTNNEQK